VVLLGVVTEVFGPALGNFEFDIKPSTWSLLRSHALDPVTNRRTVEEFVWFLERSSDLATRAFMQQSEVLRHVQECMACINDRSCERGAALRQACLDTDRLLTYTLTTLAEIRNKHDISKTAPEPRDENQ